MTKVDISSVAEEADRYIGNYYSPRLISACLKREYGPYIPMFALSWTVKKKFYRQEFSQKMKGIWLFKRQIRHTGHSAYI